MPKKKAKTKAQERKERNLKVQFTTVSVASIISSIETAIGKLDKKFPPPSARKGTKGKVKVSGGVLSYTERGRKARQSAMAALAKARDQVSLLPKGTKVLKQ